MSKAKFEQGEPVISIEEFVTNVCQWYKWNGRTVHRKFLESWQYSMLVRMLSSRQIYTAKEKAHDDVVTGSTEN